MKTKIIYSKLCAFSYLLFLVIGFNACKNRQSAEIKNALPMRPAVLYSIPVNNFPATDVDELMYHVDLEDLICPVSARTVATYEMLQGGYQLLTSLRSNEVYESGGQNYELDHDYLDATWSLTQYPRAIYDYDGTIKYYEFGLIEEDIVTSTITVYAKREAPCAIAYIFPYLLPYNFTNYDYYIGDYPHRFYNDEVGYRHVDEILDEIGYIDEPDMDDYWSQIQSQASSDEWAELSTLRQNATIIDPTYQLEVEDFWDLVDYVNTVSAHDVSLNDACDNPPSTVYNTYIENLKDYLGTNDYCRDYTAIPFCSAPIQQTFWHHIGCGVAALSWVYRGLYSTYPYGDNYLPIHGDPSSTYFEALTTCSYFHYDLDTLDNLPWYNYSQVKTTFIDRSNDVDYGLAANFFTPGFAVKWNGSWEFALAPCHLNNAFKTATDDAFGVQFLTTSLVAADWIETNNLPVLIHADICAHYVVAYGYGGISETYGGNIQRKNLYFLVTDNGYEIESNHYKPFWRRYKPCEYYYGINRID